MNFTVATLVKKPLMTKGTLVRVSGIIGVITNIDKKFTEVTSLTDFCSKDMQINPGDVIRVDFNSLIVFTDSITLSN